MALKKCKECGNEVSSQAKTCPKCGAPVPKTTALVGCLSVVIVLMVIGGISKAIGGSPSTSSVAAGVPATMVASTGNAATPAAEPAPEVAKVATAVDLSTLLSEYKGNEVRADGLFKGHLIQTTGTVGDIKNDILNHPYVTVGHGQEFEVPVLQCSLADDQAQAATTLRKGQRITVRGNVTGLMMNVLADDCRIQ
jgi:hypothetical protein